MVPKHKKLVVTKHALYGVYESNAHYVTFNFNTFSEGEWCGVVDKII